VRQPHHPTVRVLTVSTVGALSSCGTRQSGVAPDRDCSLSDAPSSSCSDSARTVRALYHFCRCPLQSTVALEPMLCWCTVQSGGTPDSLVNYSGAALLKPEGGKFRLVRPWCTRHCPVAHRTVRCARPGFSSVSFAPFF
jgi:hypothetical protein